jgi:hypothetical protein
MSIAHHLQRVPTQAIPAISPFLMSELMSLALLSGS